MKDNHQAAVSEAYRKTAEDVIYLSACAVKGVPPDADRVKGMDLARLYQAADFHLLTAATAMALESAGVRGPAFTQAKSKAVRKVLLMDAETKELFHRLDAARAADVKGIMESLGFTAEFFGLGVHDTYHKEPVSNFEIHRALFGESHDDKLFSYYRDVEARLIKGPGSERRFTPADFYLYMIAHEYKHYSGCGTGLRSPLDTFVYFRARALDMEYVAKEAGKLGIADFEAANRSLALHLFGGEELTEADRDMLDYVLSSGVYGTVAHQVRNTMKKRNWTKAQYTLHRFFVPDSRKNPDYAAYAGAYPLFYKHKFLLPILPFYRTFRSMAAGRFREEAKAIRDA